MTSRPNITNELRDSCFPGYLYKVNIDLKLLIFAMPNTHTI